MMEPSKYEFEEELVTIRCCFCGIIFAVPTDYKDCRLRDGAIFKCPNNHDLAWPIGKDIDTLKLDITKLEEENAEIKNINVRLRAQLDQLEAKMKDSQDGSK